MKKLSLPLLADTVITRRKGLKMTQAELSKRTGMNRSMLSKPGIYAFYSAASGTCRGSMF